jgi:hypothetical protein
MPFAGLAGHAGAIKNCGGQLVEQSLGLLQIERVEAFGEPAVDRSEQIAGLVSLPLIAPQSSSSLPVARMTWRSGSAPLQAPAQNKTRRRPGMHPARTAIHPQAGVVPPPTYARCFAR